MAEVTKQFSPSRKTPGFLTINIRKELQLGYPRDPQKISYNLLCYVCKNSRSLPVSSKLVEYYLNTYIFPFMNTLQKFSGVIWTDWFASSYKRALEMLWRNFGKIQIGPIAKFVNNPSLLFFVWLSILYCILFLCTRSQIKYLLKIGSSKSEHCTL